MKVAPFLFKIEEEEVNGARSEKTIAARTWWKMKVEANVELNREGKFESRRALETEVQYEG